MLLGAYNGNSADAIRAHTAWVGRAPALNIIHSVSLNGAAPVYGSLIAAAVP